MGLSTVVVSALSAATAVMALGVPRGVARQRLRTAVGGAGPVGSPGHGLAVSTVPARRGLGPVTTWRRHQERRSAPARAETVADVCAAVAAELRAGRGLDEAMRAGIEWAPSPCPEGLRAVLHVVDSGGDVVAALQRGAAEPGAEGLAAMAACWMAARASGSGLATALSRLSEALRAEQEHRRDVAAQLAGPRATARILFVLPVFGLLLSRLLGAHPIQFLFGSSVGVLCATVGAGLDVVGLVWTVRLVHQAEDEA